MLRKRASEEMKDAPLVLLSDVVSLGEVDEVDDGLGSQELELVDDLDLDEEEGCSAAGQINTSLRTQDR
jgi:hypothetical protein